MKNVGIIFLHGAGLGSFIWEGVKPLVEENALFVDFPNRGRSKSINKDLTYQDYINHIIDQINTWDAHKFILVAHSISGSIGLKIAEHFHERVAGLICISAVIPKKNTSFISCLQFPQKLIMPVVLKLFGSKPPNKAIVQELCNDLS